MVEDQSEVSSERSRPLNQEHLGDDRQQCCLVKNIPDGTDSGVAYTSGQSSSDVFQWFSMEGEIDALDVAEHEHVDSEELAEIEQVVSQARCANRSKGLVSDAQRDVW